MPKLVDIVFESGNYYIARVDKGFEVYEMGISAAKRRAFIGYLGQKGLDRAKLEVVRRQAK